MCCKAKKLSTLWLKKLMESNGGKMTFWKMIKTDGRSYFQDYHWAGETHVVKVRHKPNWNRQETSEINSGFHVYLDKNKAISDVRGFRESDDVSLLEVECDVKDLLGAEIYSHFGAEIYSHFYNTAVFSKVVVTKTGWKKFNKTTKAFLRRIGK